MIEKGTEIKLKDILGKNEAVEKVDKWRFDLGFFAEEINIEKPWGAYWKINEDMTRYFLCSFFPELKDILLDKDLDLSPKLLLVAPGARLSWQYHERRAEEWKVLAGEVMVAMSETDEIDRAQTLFAGDGVSLAKGERHRLMGTNGWGLVAEVWVHTDENNPSDEEDVVRIQDDYGR